MAGGTAIVIDVGRCTEGVVVRPRGSCTLLACATIRDYLAGRPAEETGSVFFDLSLAPGLDSTFAGMLVSLLRQGAATGSAAVHLLRPSAAAHKALQQMHVLGLFSVRESLAEEPTQWLALTSETPACDDVAECVLSAHETLIEADARNEAVFGAVVEGLRKQAGGVENKGGSSCP